MLPNELIIVTNILYSIGSVCGILFLYFRMKDAYQNENKRNLTRNWYSTVWLKIEQTGILNLPEQIIRFLLRMEGVFKNRIRIFSDKFLKIELFSKNSANLGKFDCLRVSTLLFYSLSILVIVVIKGEIFPFFVIIVLLNPFTSIISSFSTKLFRIEEEKALSATFSLILILGLIYIYAFLLSLSHLKFAIIYFVLSPFLITFNTIVFGILPIRRGEVFGLAVSISIGVTILAVFIGNIISPNSSFPNTIRLFLFNAFFDGLTLTMTLVLLKWSLVKSKSFRIPFAIILDIILAAIFGMCSIYCSFVGTIQGKSIAETFNILFARSSTGTEWELGTYFWVMHTTFIPTIIYLVIIAFAIIGKWITLPIVHALKGASGADKAHYATATTFAFIGSILFAIVKMLEWIYN